MPLLEIFTILCTGLMIGNELTVSLFINPVIWQLDDHAQAKALSLFGRLLGKVMPLWYALCLVLMIAEAYLRRHQPGFPLILTAIIFWIAIILYSIVVLVPINNRIVALSIASSLPTHWLAETKKWDTLHRWRILFLIIAMICLTWALLAPSVI
ncbi:MAG TPA: DUF1772 domain-containing protein [Edaphobacter sp.]|nr:DUF1772 domain-containing protein [Edaphobacter sp.]